MSSISLPVVNTNLRGIAYYCLAVFLLAIMDACAKWLVAGFPVGQMLFFRGLFGFVPVLIIYLMQRRADPKVDVLPRNTTGQVLRGFYVAMITLTFFVALQGMQLAEVTAIAMTGPILMVALGAVMLREHVSALRWGCVVAGFIGVLLIIQPTTQDLSLYALAAFASAVFYALAAAQTRTLTETDGFLQIILWTTVVITAIGLGFALFEPWVMPQGSDWLVLFLLGFTGGISNIFFVSAFRNAEISLLAPFDYSIFFWAILFGFMLFGELPAFHVLLGATVIIATGILLAKKTSD